MQLTLFTDYSFRILIYLATARRLVSSREIAQSFRISKDHLSKIAQTLSKLGYIKTVRGKGGGFELDPATRDVSLATVVQKLEPNMNLVECFTDAGACRLEPVCRLRHVLEEARTGFFDVLAKYTIADIVANGGELTAVLQSKLPRSGRASR